MQPWGIVANESHDGEERRNPRPPTRRPRPARDRGRRRSRGGVEFDVVVDAALPRWPISMVALREAHRCVRHDTDEHDEDSHRRRHPDPVAWVSVPVHERLPSVCAGVSLPSARRDIIRGIHVRVRRKHRSSRDFGGAARCVPTSRRAACCTIPLHDQAAPDNRARDAPSGPGAGLHRLVRSDDGVHVPARHPRCPAHGHGDRPRLSRARFIARRPASDSRGPRGPTAGHARSSGASTTRPGRAERSATTETPRTSSASTVTAGRLMALQAALSSKSEVPNVA
jgi:hypothetical protein